jgi:hypothetical protein
MTRKQSHPPTCRFQAGEKVRVPHGVRDPDFPDVPLGGWAGTVKEVGRASGDPTYLVAWDRETLDAMHPVYKNRCERDGLELGSMWLSESDLEPDDGTRVPIEQPSSIVTKPLSDSDQDDRVRKALGLTHDDPIPDVSPETLRTYHRFLAANLQFPHFTTYTEETRRGPSGEIPVTITGLLSPEGDDLDESCGLLCRGLDRTEQVELPLDAIAPGKKNPNRRLLVDYSYWFHNWR